MELSDIWRWYCEQHLPSGGKLIPQPNSPDEVLAAFWSFHPLFQGRADAIKATPYDAAFDAEADAALLAMAETDDFASWDVIPAGAWRVLYERFLYCTVVVEANRREGVSVIDTLPAGLAPQAKARALLLRYLLGAGRAIDRRLLPRSAPGTAPLFPASAPIRRQ